MDGWMDGQTNGRIEQEGREGKRLDRQMNNEMES